MEAIKHSFRVFDKNRKKLLEECPGKFVVVVGETIQEKRYDSLKEAFVESIKTHKLGEFIIQHVVDDSANFSLI